MRRTALVLVAASPLIWSAACGSEPSPARHAASTNASAGAAQDGGRAVAGPGVIPISNMRGPGTRRQPAGALQLLVPRTLDLTHVEPQHFAAALGNDPSRIFEYVRDEIGYEAYAGCLRGPRGTLLAMAGNSIDRAALLASMLQHGRHRVRFARATLPDSHATALVMSMWTASAFSIPSPPEAEIDSRLRAVVNTAVAAAKRDYTMIREHLVKVANRIQPDSGPTIDQLKAEAQPHYWVQWEKDGRWIDLDPSFADAAPGQAYAKPAEILDALPESVFHRVDISVKLEEYTGEVATTRNVLTYSVRAAELSGVDVVFSHQPERWAGPDPNLPGALGSAVENTGRIKPVLIVGTQAITGEPFRQRPPSRGGLGSLSDMLGGAGSRHAVAIATGQSIEIDVVAMPAGRKQTVVREVFDLAGASGRRARRPMTSAEVASRAAGSADLTRRIYTLLFGTGRIAEPHVVAIAADGSKDAADVRSTLRRLAVTLNAASDATTVKVTEQQDAPIHFYFDSPRLTIVELAEDRPDHVRLALDLRRNTPRAAALGARDEAVVFARIARGVLDGALERMVMDYVSEQAGRSNHALDAAISTSALFEVAVSQREPALLFPVQRANLTADAVPEDALARIDADTSAGYLAVAPGRAVSIAGTRRYAWWRVDPRSGETTAVTDDGLHGAAQEFTFQVSRNANGTRVVNIYYVNVFRQRILIQTIDPARWPGGLAALLNWLRAQGFHQTARTQLPW